MGHTVSNYGAAAELPLQKSSRCFNTLRIIQNIPWYVSNRTKYEDLKIPLINDSLVSTDNDRSMDHNNQLTNKMTKSLLESEARGLKRKRQENLTNRIQRFTVSGRYLTVVNKPRN